MVWSCPRVSSPNGYQSIIRNAIGGFSSHSPDPEVIEWRRALNWNVHYRVPLIKEQTCARIPDAWICQSIFWLSQKWESMCLYCNLLHSHPSDRYECSLLIISSKFLEKGQRSDSDPWTSDPGSRRIFGLFQGVLILRPTKKVYPWRSKQEAMSCNV